MQKHLETLTEYIRIYKDCDATTDGNTLSVCLQHITSSLFFLEIERAKYHQLWNDHVAQMILEGNSVNRAENMAHVKYPEMYKLRRIMDAGYKCSDSIRSQISYIKQQLNNQ